MRAPSLTAAFVMALVLNPALCSAAENTADPRFDAFQVPAEGDFKPARVKIASAKSREFASELQAAQSQKPNFAGHFIFAEFGCGASCVMSAAIDAKTGDVAWLPFTVCCSDVDEPIEFKPDSRLLKIRGSRNEKGSGTYFYVFDGRSFKQISTPQKQ
jgi:hypothetical protein